MVTKAVIKSINSAGNRCIVQIPLFETASSTSPVEAEALVCITPGMFNNLAVNDIVYIAFEENAIEKPVIIGKLFKTASSESTTNGGACILDTLKVRSTATIPSSTLFEFTKDTKNEYKDLQTPKKIADYIKWLEKFTKKLISQADNNFRCFKNWAQWQLQPENVEVDDGDIDNGYHVTEPLLYQEEGADCQICGANCVKNKTRCYLKTTVDTTYPNI